MLLTTKNSVREALRGNTTINKISIVQGVKDGEILRLVSDARKKRIKIEYLNRQAHISKFGRTQGIACETVDFKYSEVKEMLDLATEKSELPFILILDGINDPHNFGAIIRSAECAGVHGIIIPKDRSCAVNDTVLKVSTGAAENMLIARVPNLNNEIEKLKKEGLWVWASEAGGTNIHNVNLKGPIAVIIGSEGEGVSRLTKERCDGVISLEMHGKVNSLNASVATGIVLFEILRQRGI